MSTRRGSHSATSSWEGGAAVRQFYVTKYSSMGLPQRLPTTNPMHKARDGRTLQMHPRDRRVASGLARWRLRRGTGDGADGRALNRLVGDR